MVISEKFVFLPIYSNTAVLPLINDEVILILASALNSMEKSSIDVLVVDDHTLFRKGMVMIVNTFPGINKVYDAENGQKALELLESKPVDIMLLDLDMPVLDGWETSKKVLEKYPGVHIIMISMHDSLSVVSKLIDSGVHSYILKSAPPEEVQKAIVCAINNDFYYNQIVANALKHRVKEETNNVIEDESNGLTKREVEILELICQEMTMKEIGEFLTISEATIQTHRKNLMKKIAAKNAVGLVKYAFQKQLISF